MIYLQIDNIHVNVHAHYTIILCKNKKYFVHIFVVIRSRLLVQMRVYEFIICSDGKPRHLVNHPLDSDNLVTVISVVQVVVVSIKRRQQHFWFQYNRFDLFERSIFEMC